MMLVMEEIMASTGEISTRGEGLGGREREGERTEKEEEEKEERSTDVYTRIQFICKQVCVCQFHITRSKTPGTAQTGYTRVHK